MTTVTDVVREFRDKEKRISELYAEIASIRLSVIKTIHDLSQEAMRLDPDIIFIRCNIGEDIDSSMFGEVIGSRGVTREYDDLDENDQLPEEIRKRLHIIEKLLKKAIMFFAPFGPFEGVMLHPSNDDTSYSYFEHRFKSEVLGETTNRLHS